MTTKTQLLRTIKLQCQECMGSTAARKGNLDGEAANLVKECSAPECCLFPYREGKDPRPIRRADNLKLGVRTSYLGGQTGEISKISS
jgi:hypothetical protein